MNPISGCRDRFRQRFTERPADNGCRPQLVGILCRIAHDLKGLLERLQVLRGDEDGRGLAVHGDGHPPVMVVDAEVIHARASLTARDRSAASTGAGAPTGWAACRKDRVARFS
jgi:hypothetical protein